jgi:hypothetical protein
MKEGPVMQPGKRIPNMAEIMDAEDPLFILYTRFHGNHKNGYSQQDIIIITQQMYLIMKTTIFLVVGIG